MKLHAIVSTAALLAMGLFAYADGEHATGFLPSPRTETLHVREAMATRRSPLLKSSPESALPAKWDARDYGWVSSVKNQGQVGSCWAFAAIATIETQLLKSGMGERDFSERNMANMAASPYTYEDGGNDELAAGYLLRWSGPVDERNDPYTPTTNQWNAAAKPTFRSELHIHDVVWIAPLDGTDASRDTLKRAITNYGAVATVLYMDQMNIVNDSHYYDGNEGPDHAVTVVGWDDDFPTNKFKKAPPNNGAWLIKNSWGTDWGSAGGYFWVSYCDTQFGQYFNSAIFLPQAAGDEGYDSVHGHNCNGLMYDTATEGYPSFSNCDLQAVVFTAAWKERLAAVGFWTTLIPTPYEISVYTNVTRHTTSHVDEVIRFGSDDAYLPASASPLEGGALACTVSGSLTHAGYTTIPLGTEIPLEAGSSYAIVVRQTSSTVSIPVNCKLPLGDDPIYGNVKYGPGNGYLGTTREGGEVDWTDAYDTGIYANDNDGWALCIMAYTRNGADAPTTDEPGMADDGTSMLLEAAATNSTLFTDTYSFEPMARLVGANGRSLWTSYVAGFDPSSPTGSEFVVSISITNNIPCIKWTPDLGEKRTYTIYGAESLSPLNWQPVDDLATTAAKFFRVSVSPRNP